MEDLPESGWKSSKEESDICLPVSTSNSYQEGIDYIFKEQGKLNTQIFGNVTLKGIRKIFLTIVEEVFPSLSNQNNFGFFSNKVLMDPESTCLILIFWLI